MDKQYQKIKGVASSFVFSNMKLSHDKGAGEAKLFVGPKKNESDYDAFFEFGTDYSYLLEKSNLLQYLQQVKIEYVFQKINKYKDANLNSWNENYAAINEMDETDFNIKLTKFVDASRYYVRADEDILKKTMRKIIIPKLTDIIFEKDVDKKTIVLRLEVNYDFKNAAEEQEDTFDVDNKDKKYDTGYESVFSRNRILFGAPGTGKSFNLNRDKDTLLENGGEYERATFHPDYSYANFVGTYKPVMINSEEDVIVPADKKEIFSILLDKSKTAQEKYNLLYDKFNGEGLTRLPLLLGLYTDENFKTLKKDGTDAVGDNSVERNHGRYIRPYVHLISDKKVSNEIAYEYVPGPFMRTLVKALKNVRTGNPKPYLLIIEEINRANVAAVFGDIFQLLDRGDNGVSEYPICATEDIKKYLAKPENLGGNPEDYAEIRIPDNMFIWATMNSADQGVFPMDTAFKRRWDFTYLGIDDAVGDISESIKNRKYTLGKGKNARLVNWNDLRSAINDVLSSETYNINEDKLLGPYFVSKVVLENEKDEEFIKVFKNKVLMYLFDDAAKQKKKTFFEKCKDDVKGIRYSDICKQFDTKGVFIFPEEVFKRFTDKPTGVDGTEEGVE